MSSGISNSYGPLCLFFISKLSKMSQNQLQASHGKVVIPLFDLPYEEKFIRICGGKSGRGSLIIRRRNFSQTYLKFYRS